MEMKSADRKYLLKEAQQTLDESDSTAAFCLCQKWILKDAIALLKEQEPMEPKVKHFELHYASYDEYENKAYCPKCGIQFIQQVNYCPKCGQAVKWND